MDPVYVKSDDVVYRKIAGEFVLVPIRQKVVDLKSIYTLNETGALVWESIDGLRTAADIEKKVVEEYDIGPAQAGPDVAEILAGFESLQLICRKK